MPPSTSPLSRSLRRSAARPAGPRGRAPSPRLQAAADTGLLTRSNTKPRSAGRQAVDRAEYLRRRAAEPELSAREAAGHRVAGSRERTGTFFTSDPGPRWVTITGPALSLRDVQRAARYMGDVGALIADLRRDPAHAARTKARWEARMRRRAPIGGLPLLADADAAILLADALRQEGDAAIVFDSGRSRPGRRRRSTRRAR